MCAAEGRVAWPEGATGEGGRRVEGWGGFGGTVREYLSSFTVTLPWEKQKKLISAHKNEHRRLR